MNIFVLDKDITACARAHCDRHVHKMILESVQMMCTALNARGFETPYRPTHANHPCVNWVAESYDNFLWLEQLATELNREYRHRYERPEDHKSIGVLRKLVGMKYEENGLTEFAQAMPDEYRIPGDAVTAYRRFYRAEKAPFATWTRRNAPDWWLSHAA